MDPANAQAHVLVIDDDRDIQELLAAFLQKQGMRVSTRSDGRDLAAQLTKDPVDLLVLDLNLPYTDGLAVCRNLRAQGIETPVIMLTARGDPVDRVIGLEIGADDYLAKPFEPRELSARIRSVLRRSRGTPGGAAQAPANHAPRAAERLTFSGWTLDVPARQLLSPEGAVVVLTSGEFRLLRILAENAGRVLNRDQLMQQTQGRDSGAFDRSIDLHISRLRAKLRDDGKNPSLLRTVRNEGYILVATVERE